jgi:hypothetical protein
MDALAAERLEGRQKDRARSREDDTEAAVSDDWTGTDRLLT